MPMTPTPSRLLAAAVLLLTTLAVPAHTVAQTLARPGWAGSGMNIAPWWHNTVIYQLDPHGFDQPGDLASAAKHLDYLQSLGIDMISLTNLYPAAAPDPAAAFKSLDPALGTLDDLDTFVREASRSNIRVVIEIDPVKLADPAALASVARFWLSRGVAGISLTSAADSGTMNTSQLDASQRAAQLRAVHALTHSIPGPRRILIGEAASAADKSALRDAGADLVLDPVLARVNTFDAASLRAALQGTFATVEGAVPVISTDGPRVARSISRLGDGSHNEAIAKVLATTLLATRAAPRLYFGQEIGLTANPDATPHMSWGVAPDPAAKKVVKPAGPEVAAEDADPDSVLSWYRRLIEIHHGNAAFRTGALQMVNRDDRNVLVWISKREPVSLAQPPVVIICNLSAQPLNMSLTEDMKNLHLRGNFLRTILRSDNAMGGLSLDAIKLPPYGIYIGELRY